MSRTSITSHTLKSWSRMSITLPLQTQSCNESQGTQTSSYFLGLRIYKNTKDQFQSIQKIFIISNFPLGTLLWLGNVIKITI